MPASARLSLGVPQAVAIASPTPGEGDDFSHFTEGNFFLVYLACSFDPDWRERVIDASLAIELTRADGIDEPAPIAWSMEPHCLAHVTEFSRSQKVDASLKIIKVSIGGESRSQTTECRVQAFNELQSNPRWDFRHSRGAQLRGTQRLMLVVQTSAPTRAVISLRGNVRRGLLRRRTPLVARDRVLELTPQVAGHL